MRKEIKKGLPAYLYYTDQVMLYLSSLCSVLILVHVGYGGDAWLLPFFDGLVNGLFAAFALLFLMKNLSRLFLGKRKGRFQVGELLVAAYFWLVLLGRYGSSSEWSIVFLQPAWLYLGVFAVCLIELSKYSLFFDRFYFNPTILFVLSFLLLILLGMVLLILPKATVDKPLSFVDALFMSTSAVCITGLSVVDVATRLSQYGQLVLIILVQLGGLGIMTFTGFFGYFFSGAISYKNQLMYTEILGEKKLASVISTLLRIILITLFFEALGAVFIYFSVSNEVLPPQQNRLFFAVFHAVSAFCNAGFSTVPDGLAYGVLRFSYGLQLVMALLFILGGLGFGIVFNTFSFLKRWAVNIFRRVFMGKAFKHSAWVISFNSRLIAWTTSILLLISTIGVLLLEYRHGLADHRFFAGKLATAFFLGATPRSAGFTTVDMANLSLPTLMLIFMLMWIGASPGSTGGGIKVSTFAVAMLNLASLVRGKERVEIFGREISDDSLRRAFSIILLSLLATGISIFCLSVSDGHLGMKPLAFEAFSAYSTAGLSLGITQRLSDTGRLVLIMSMFVGRVGALTLLIAMARHSRLKSYRYAQEKVLF